MISSIRATIRAFVAPEHRLACSVTLWRALLAELGRRGNGERETGAFLLGRRIEQRRYVHRVAYYDDLDPTSLDTGIVVFDGRGYGPLWALCRETGLTVVADIHTHAGIARQSSLDRDNPMIATRGHVAVIVPGFAQSKVRVEDLGVYEYEGAHRWRHVAGGEVQRYFYIGFWT